MLVVKVTQQAIIYVISSIDQQNLGSGQMIKIPLNQLSPIMFQTLLMLSCIERWININLMHIDEIYQLMSHVFYFIAA